MVLTITAGLVGLTVLTALSYSVEVATDYAFVCENTASTHGYREWAFGLRSHAWYRESVLESFLRNRTHTPIVHRWTNCAGTGKNIFGSSISFGHGRPGGALLLSYAGVLDTYFEGRRDSEIVDLYRFLCKADKSASEIRCRKIWNDAMDTIASPASPM